VILGTALAALYEAETKRFSEAVRRNLAKFPADFMLQLTIDEWSSSHPQERLATFCLGANPNREGRQS
jgi:ORF6N domain